MADGKAPGQPGCDVGVDLVAVRKLLARADAELDAAAVASSGAMQYLHAHMAAIRTAAALLTMSAAATARRRRLTSVWDQLADAGPQWQRWAARFAAGAPTRAAIEAGLIAELEPQAVSAAIAASIRFREQVGAVAGTATAAPVAMAS
ncbi:MAG: SAV_6107 family HEPN domain-containing protein [Beutenbergiaceae bacterium]